MRNEDQILAYLHFGYLPKFCTDLESKSWAKFGINSKKPKINIYDEALLIEKGIKSFKSSIANNIEEGYLNIVPLSGGLDSRAILAGLIDLGLKEEIITVTFGTPTTFDYDLGKYIAQQAGVKYEVIDLTEVELDQSSLEEVAQTTNNWTYLIDSFYNYLIRNKFGKDVVYWSGFMGDPLAGSHSYDTNFWEDALDKFIYKNRFSKSIKLTPKSFNPKDILPQEPLLNKEISYIEQLDFSIRQEAAIKPIVLSDDYNYKTPFLDQEWVNFILSIPQKYRNDEYLYKKILQKAYPDLFSLPTANNFGLPLEAPQWRKGVQKLLWHWRSSLHKVLPSSPWVRRPGINYIDFKEGLIKRKDLKNIIYNNMQDLKQRKIINWIDFDKIWNEHQSQKYDHSKALILLASLEIYLKSSK